jgi:hypothetical protein
MGPGKYVHQLTKIISLYFDNQRQLFGKGSIKTGCGLAVIFSLL